MSGGSLNSRQPQRLLALSAAVLCLYLSGYAPPAVSQGRPWGQGVTEGITPYQREPGPRRYNPWARLRDEPRESETKEKSTPRYREHKKQTMPERKLPQFYDQRGVPAEYYPFPGQGVAPYSWGSNVMGPWGYAYQPMWPGPGFMPWGYGGW